MDENHTRVLGSALLIVEKQIHRIIRELDASDKSQLIMYSIKDDLDQASKAKILGTSLSMLDKIDQIKELFRLGVGEESTKRRIISVLLSSIWVILEELNPEKMRGYGEISSTSDRELLRRHILTLLGLVDDMETAIM